VIIPIVLNKLKSSSILGMIDEGIVPTFILT
jgi:hypothetical protein